MNVQFECACIVLTTQCNIKCKFCYRPTARQKFLDAQHYETILKKLKKLGYTRVNLTGGEPLLHPNIKEFIHKAAQMGFEIVLSTNAVLLDLDDPVYEKVQLITASMDGSNAAVNASVRGPGQYECVVRTLDQFRRGNYPFQLKINTVMTRHNYDDLLKIADMLQHYKVFWRVFYCKDKGIHNTMQQNEYIDPDCYMEKIREIDSDYPGLLMVDACRRDVSGDLCYTFVSADGEFIVSDVENDITVGSLVSQDTEEILTRIHEIGCTIVEHNGLVL